MNLACHLSGWRLVVIFLSSFIENCNVSDLGGSRKMKDVKYSISSHESLKRSFLFYRIQELVKQWSCIGVSSDLEKRLINKFVNFSVYFVYFLSAFSSNSLHPNITSFMFYKYIMLTIIQFSCLHISFYFLFLNY